MIRPGFLILIALVASLKTMPALAAHLLPPEAGFEMIVSPAAGQRQPSDSGAIARTYPSREPALEDELGGRMQGKVSYYSALTPLLIACGALLAMVSLRNSDIANRSRVAVDALEKTNDPRRVRSLKRQITWFNYRYVLCSISFISLASAGSLFALSAPWSRDGVSLFELHKLAVWGVDFLMAGLGLLCLEFLLGPITVISNSRSVAK